MRNRFLVPPLLACAGISLAALLASAPAHAAPQLGYQERFSGTSLSGWASGSALSNPGTGGVGGAGDGYLHIAVTGPFGGNLGAYGPTAPYVGDWTAAGITRVRLWLTDDGVADPLEIHVGIGNAVAGNFWQCNTGFIPPQGYWAPFVVDLSQPANFTFIGLAAGTYAAALQNVDRILLRHDLAPYTRVPDTVIGDFGLDEVRLENATTGVDGDPRPIARGLPVQLAPPAPNPSRGSVTFRLRASDDAPIRLQVVDASGRVLRHAELAGGAGERAWVWDGADDRGARTAPGYYRVRAYSRGGGTSQPLVRVP
jgi:hypothetical protein